eukprot:7387085-Prymnesium_polylepis.1
MPGPRYCTRRVDDLRRTLLTEEDTVACALPELGERQQEERPGSDRVGWDVDDARCAQARGSHVDDGRVLEVQLAAKEMKASTRYREGSFHAAVGDDQYSSGDRHHAA